jgi:hypothetical protein
MQVAIDCNKKALFNTSIVFFFFFSVQSTNKVGLKADIKHY